MNFLLIFFRDLKRNKTITFINTGGLIIGILSTLLILEYVYYHRSFDSYHENADNVYRIVYNRYGNEGLMWKTTNFYTPAAPYLKTNFAEVEDYALLFRKFNIIVNQFDAQGNPLNFRENKSYYANSFLFSIFDFPLIIGDKNCLDNPNTVAISDKLSKKYFDSDNPIGKTLKINGKETYVVTAVFKTIPSNSHLQSDLFFSVETLIKRRPQMMNDWVGDGALPYLKLKNGADYKAFEKKAFPQMIQENYADYLTRSQQKDSVYLQPIKSIHLQSNLEYELEPPGNGKAISILFIFSIFFIIVAWINYANLASVKYFERAKEISIKKVNGLSRSKIIIQLLSEAVIFNLFCYLFAIVIFILINPRFLELTQIQTNSQILPISFWIFFSISICLGVIISNIHPAFVLTTYNPAKVLKGKFSSSKSGILFRKTLVTTQFIISILLLVGSIVAYKQIKFLIDKDMGVNCKNKVAIKIPRANGDRQLHDKKVLSFKDELSKYPGIGKHTYCSDLPGNEINGFFGGYKKGGKPDDLLWYFGMQIDENFSELYKPKLLAGRSFIKDDQPSSKYIIFNNTGIKRLGYNSADEAINHQVINHKNEVCTIIGVFNDFHFRSIKHKAVATCYTIQENQKKYLIFDLANIGNQSQKQFLEKAQLFYSDIFPGYEFEYSYVNDHLIADLSTDKTFATVVTLFSILAIIIALIGIIGLLLITTNQNISDFAVRKVLGAKTNQISVQLFKQFLSQYIIATLIAIPLSIWLFNKWITTNYIHHIDLKVSYWTLPVTMILVIVWMVMVVIAYSTYKSNTVETLRSE